MVHDDGPVGLDGVEVALTTSGRSRTRGSCWRRRCRPARDRGAGRRVVSISATARARATRAQGDDVGARRWCWAPTASMTATCCASGRTAGSARASRDGALDAGHVSARVHVRACPPARPRARPRRSSARGRPAPGRATSGSSSMSTRFVGEVVRAAQAGRRPSATPQSAAITRSSPRAPTRGEVLHIRLRKGSANTSRGMRALLRRADRPRRPRRRDRRRSCCAPTRGFWNDKMFDAARSRGLAVLDRRAPATRRPRARSRRSTSGAGPRCDDYPDTSIAQIAETTLERSPADRPPRPHARSSRPSCCRPGSCFRFVTNRTDDARPRRGRAPPARRRRARDPRPQRPSARALPLRPLHRQRRLDGDRRARAQPAALDQTCSAPRGHTVRAARTLRRRLLALPGRLTRTARRWTLHLPARWPWRARLHRSAHPHPRAPRRPEPPTPPTTIPRRAVATTHALNRPPTRPRPPHARTTHARSPHAASPTTRQSTTTLEFPRFRGHLIAGPSGRPATGSRGTPGGRAGRPPTSGRRRRSRS